MLICVDQEYENTSVRLDPDRKLSLPSLQPHGSKEIDQRYRSWRSERVHDNAHLQARFSCQIRTDAVVTSGFVTGFCVHDAVHHPARVQHVDDKDPHYDGGQGGLLKHAASFSRLCQYLTGFNNTDL